MVFAQGDGVTFHVAGWVSFIVGLGTLATAITGFTVFTRKVLVPFGKTVAATVESMRVMGDIADRFGANGHETISAELQALAVNDEISAENQREMLARLAAIADRTELIDTKLSETRHKIIGEFAALTMGGESTITIVEALERTSATLLRVKDDLRVLKDEISADRRPTEEES